MTASTMRMPTFRALAAALRRTTERLAQELTHPSDSQPDWTETEWTIARSVAAMQGISALLANTLRWEGLPSWRTFLAEQREQSCLRHEHIGSLLERIDAVTRERKVGCVALKGAAIRGLGLYRPGERPMGDVDLLVADRDLRSIAAAMADIDYAEAFTTDRHRVYEPLRKVEPRGFGEHVENPLKIEIHTAVAERLPERKKDDTERQRPRPERTGLNNYPDLVALLLHLLLHAAGNMRAHALRQIQLHDIAMVASLLDQSDWRRLLAQSDGEEPWWMFPPLVLTARYYPERVPEAVLRTAGAACPRILRVASARHSLTDVSWSNLRIYAFPGIEWSRTPLDVVQLVRARVAPTRRSFAELALARRAQPLLDDVPWYGISQGGRILRWLFSRPPRVQTIASVRAALESVDEAARCK